MRVWRTQLILSKTLKDLDDQRLIAQHREAVGMLSMSAGKDREKFRNNPLRFEFENHHAYLFQVHDLAVKEMENRGFFGHKTPVYPQDFPFYTPGQPFKPTKEEVEFDREDLCQRYIQHSEEVIRGIRKGRSDYLRWTRTGLPEWLTQDAIQAILEEREFLGRK